MAAEEKPRTSASAESRNPSGPSRKHNNLFQIVAYKKPVKHPPPCPYLIKFTEKLAEEAKKGVLRGLGGFAEYEEGYIPDAEGPSYIIGLEGSYYENPENTIVPLKKLEWKIMLKIEEDERKEG